MVEQAREPWKQFQEVYSIFPRPISESYMFKERELWCEDAAFETRMRRAGKRAPEKTGRAMPNILLFCLF